jgi:hypothetical protein
MLLRETGTSVRETGTRGLKLLVYEPLSYWCMSP